MWITAFSTYEKGGDKEFISDLRHVQLFTVGLYWQKVSFIIKLRGNTLKKLLSLVLSLLMILAIVRNGCFVMAEEGETTDNPSEQTEETVETPEETPEAPTETTEVPVEQPEETEVPSENQYEPKKGYINSSMVTVRLQPSTAGGYLEDENYGPHYVYRQEVLVINEAYDESDNLWYEVTFTVNDKEYDTWAFGTYVTILAEGEEPGEIIDQNPDEEREARVIESSVRIRTGPGTEYPQFRINNEVQYFTKGQTIYILAEEKDTDGDIWYKVRFELYGNEYVQYIYSTYAQIKVTMTDENYEQYLNEQNFPESYRESLRELHALYPEWNFVAHHTGLQWQEVVDMESRLGYSLISGSNLAYRSVAEGAYDVVSKRFYVYDGSNWYCANRETVAYYIDPRNFLNQYNIFMFLNLSFHESETPETIQKLLDSTFMKGTDSVSGKTFANIFYEAGQSAGVSPIYLAVLARQEQGTSGSRACTGESFTYNGRTYSGLYNFYNIGATSGEDNWKKGLIYANGSEDGSYTSYNRPWNSPYKSIVGGGMWIADGYINDGQNTMYLQKFNVTDVNTYGHQYMTNIQAAYSQSGAMYDTYQMSDSLKQPLNFSIPVYQGMPASTSLPTTYTLPTTLEEQRNMESANPTIEPEPEPIAPVYTGDFITDMSLKLNEGFLTGIQIGTTLKKMTDKIKSSNENCTVVIIGADGTELNGESVIGTGCVLEITDASGTSKYTIIIRGDINSDGKVNLQDLLLVKKNILGMNTLEGNMLKAAMINGETEVTLKTYLAIKKYILGMQDIPQE